MKKAPSRDSLQGNPVIGIVGFGEAGKSIARTLRIENPRLVMWCFDQISTPSLKEEARQLRVAFASDLNELLSKSDVVLVIVPPDQAETVAELSAPALNSAKLYVDATSIGPSRSRGLAKTLEKSSAWFVKAAIMDAVKNLGHRVPMLLGGDESSRGEEILNALGFNTRAVGADESAVMRIKLARSVFLKSYIALTVEFATLIEAYALPEVVLSSIAESMDAESFIERWDRQLEGHLRHQKRRAFELKEALNYFERCDLSMALAALRILESSSSTRAAQGNDHDSV